MATLGKVASRYAKAIFDGLKSNKNANGVLSELEAFAQAASGHGDLSLLFSSPGFSAAKKEEVVSDIATKMGLSADSKQILLGIARMERLDQLSPIVERLRVRLLENEGVAPIEVWTAEAVSEADRKPIEAKFAQILGKKVRAQYATNPALVGGLRVVAGGRTFDGTLSGWLDSLSESLVEGEA